MTELQFQIIALAPGRSPSVATQIAQGLCSALRVDLANLGADLVGEGVCVAYAANLEQAQQIAAIVLREGADYRILDPQGSIAENGAAAPSHVSAGTVLGGFQAPSMMPPPLAGAESDSQEGLVAVPPAGGVFSEENDAEVPLAAPSGPTGLTDPELCALDFASSVGAAPAPAPAETTPPAPASAAPAPAPPRNPASTMPPPSPPQMPAPPSSDEIDQSALVMLDGSAGAEAKPSPNAPHAIDPDAAFKDASFSPPEADEALELDEPVPTRAPDPAPMPPQEAGQSEQLQPIQELKSASGRTSPPLNQTQTLRRTKGGSARRRPGGAFVLFDGRLREWPRLRVTAGFALALGLGAILPTCHANSVMTEQVAPLRRDLSTVKAYGRLSSEKARYRTLDEITDRIDSIKGRHRSLSFLMWLASGLGLLFLWFRFT